MKTFLTLLSLVLMAKAMGQESQTVLHKAKKSAGNVAEGPVTQSEAREVFLKLDKALQSVSHITGTPPAVKLGEKGAPVTRDQVVIEMGREFDYVRPYFTLKLKPMDVDPSIITLKDPAAKAIAQRLAAWGCIARFGPLLAGKSQTMDVQLFGDSLGLFIGRLAELTHTPSSRFSPYLNGVAKGP